MEILLPSFELVAALPPYPAVWESLTDRWDVPIWAAAQEGKANVVVSENRRDYPPADASGRHVYQGVDYLPARKLLARLTSIE